jgi:pimeloyl-ACP methyl ester carboxylesterase
MSSIVQPDDPQIPIDVNFVSQGKGNPVVLIHGLAASLHDWDALIPRLVESGYSTYALDLLGHGESPKPETSAYQMDWLVDHFIAWMERLNLAEPPVVVGHSLGGYVALEYARRFPARTRGLVLVDPFYSNSQLPTALRMFYSQPRLSSFFLTRSPRWLVRWVIDITSMLMEHRTTGRHALPEEVRAQTVSDYLRTAPAAYGILKAELDLAPYLSSITVPSLVLWGERDHTLAPASFATLVSRLPKGIGRSSVTGHVPHQADVEWFNGQVLAFLKELGQNQRENLVEQAA